MKNIHVFYSLKGDQYQLQYEGKTVYVDKDKWNTFIREQHGGEGLSLSGGIGVDPEEFKKITNN